MWLVVKFIEENSVEVVPGTWYITEDKMCAWPHNEKRSAIYSFIKSKCYPKDNWKMYPVKILGQYGKSLTTLFLFLKYT